MISSLSVCSVFSVFSFFAQSFRVYQLYSHDIKGCKNEECLERAKILYTLTADEVSNHVSRTVEEFQKGTSKAIIYIEEASGNVLSALLTDSVECYGFVRNGYSSCRYRWCHNSGRCRFRCQREEFFLPCISLM